MSDITKQKPGYKKTALGWIPEEWGESTLGAIAKISSGGTPDRKNKAYWNGNIPWVTTSLINFSPILNANEFITEEGLKNSAAKLFPVGTILMALYGQGVTRGKTSVLQIEATTNQACAAIFPSPTITSTEFLSYFLASKYEDIRNLSNTGNQENLNGEIVKSIPIPLPPLPEQRAIAGVLGCWDKAIGTLSALIAQKQARKKWLMQVLLTGKRRLPGFSDGSEHGKGAWRTLEFGELASVRGKKVDPVGKEATRCIEMEHIDQGTGTISGWVDSSQQKSLKNQFQKGDVLFGKLRPYLRKFWLAQFDGLCSTEIWVLVANPRTCSNEFLFQLVQSDQFMEYANVSSGSKMPRADWDYTSEAPFEVPPLAEQAAITNVLVNCDKEIALLGDQLSAIKVQKKGLMQELLTGRKQVLTDTFSNNE